MGFNDDTQSTNGGFNLQEVYEHKREEHLRNMRDKEDEMRQVNSQIKSNASQKYIKFSIGISIRSDRHFYIFETRQFLNKRRVIDSKMLETVTICGISDK